MMQALRTTHRAKTKPQEVAAHIADILPVYVKQADQAGLHELAEMLREAALRAVIDQQRTRS